MTAKSRLFVQDGEGLLRELGWEVQRCRLHTFKLSSEWSADRMGNQGRGGGHASSRTFPTKGRKKSAKTAGPKTATCKLEAAATSTAQEWVHWICLILILRGTRSAGSFFERTIYCYWSFLVLCRDLKILDKVVGYLFLQKSWTTNCQWRSRAVAV